MSLRPDHFDCFFASLTDYSDEKVKRIINSELADTFGNLLSRCCAKSLNKQQLYPEYDSNAVASLSKQHGDLVDRLLESTTSLAKNSHVHYEDISFHALVDTVMEHLRLTNNFFETLKPWQMAKDETQKDSLNATLLLTMESLRVASIILQPLIPNMTQQLLDKLNVPQGERRWLDAEQLSWSRGDVFKGRPLNDAVSPLLFKRII